MDVNEAIARARAAHQDHTRQDAARAASFALDQAALRLEVDEICRKFVQWARQSGTPVTIYVRNNRATTTVGTGRKERTIPDPTATIGVWALDKYEGTSEGARGETRFTNVLLGIDTDGNLYPPTPPVGSGRIPPVDTLMRHIVQFIARTGSTVPWPDSTSTSFAPGFGSAPAQTGSFEAWLLDNQ